MPNFLWGFINNSIGTSSSSPNTLALPEIKPAGSISNGISTGSIKTPTSLVNVVRDFYWTYSPVGDVARAEVPRIILTERKLRTNALISQLKYSLGQTFSGGAQTLQNIQQFGSSTGATAALQNVGSGLTNFLSSLTNSAAGQAVGQAAQGLGTAVTDEASKVGGQMANSSVVQTGLDIAKNAYAQVSNAVGSAFADDNNPTVNSSPWLAPYRNLYLTDPTGWVYVLPYFNNNQTTQSNSFADSGETGVISDLLGKPAAAAVTGAAGFFASLNSPAQITYIEKTKFYNYPTEGEDITVEFPLINTGNVTYDDVVRNWQFLFLLVYQNRPGKTSQNTVDQPVIYQVEVPGNKFFPFCYIQSLNIEFMGSRREMNITVPSNTSVSADLGLAGQAIGSQVSSVSIPAIIPDAYKVTISLKSMIANSKNFMQHMIGPHQLISTGTA
jgi:hypothetical protein